MVSTARSYLSHFYQLVRSPHILFWSLLFSLFIYLFIYSFISIFVFYFLSFFLSLFIYLFIHLSLSLVFTFFLSLFIYLFIHLNIWTLRPSIYISYFFFFFFYVYSYFHFFDESDIISYIPVSKVTGDLGGASPLEVTRFFLPLMRQLTRTLCGGTCVYSRSRANPYAHTSSRCQAFLALLQVLGKVVPEVTLYKDKDKPGCTNNPGGGIGSEELLLQAYVEFFLDEEVNKGHIFLSFLSLYFFFFFFQCLTLAFVHTMLYSPCFWLIILLFLSLSLPLPHSLCFFLFLSLSLSSLCTYTHMRSLCFYTIISSIIINDNYHKQYFCHHHYFIATVRSILLTSRKLLLHNFFSFLLFISFAGS